MDTNHKLTIDFETRSAADLGKCGAAAYAEHPSTEVTCLAVKLHGQEPVIWFSPDFRFPNCPAWAALPVIDNITLRQMIAEADIIEAHNMYFEFNIWKYTMPRYGFTTKLPLAKLLCSAAKAVSCGLPRSLEDACNAIGIAQRKDTEGAALMKKLCVPRKPTLEEQKADPDWRKQYFWNGTPEDFAREGLYCMQDVRATETLSDALPDLSRPEQRIWQMDLVINDRGLYLDARSVEALKVCTDVERTLLIYEFQKITKDEDEGKDKPGIDSPNNVGELLEYLKEHGVETDSLSDRVVSSLLKSNLNPKIRRVLEIRQACAKSSTAKLEPMVHARNKDGRVRGSLLYHGAVTGRWAGKGLQPQNFPRGTLGSDERVEACIAAFNRGDLDLIRREYGDVMTAAASCLRGMIVPAPGHDFIGADFSSIEGRVLAWLAGEETALVVYREGRDPYKVNAAQIYGVDYDFVSKDQRQVGKVAELALGYQGSVGAFSRMGATYGVELPKEEIKIIVDQWRWAHPMTKKLWSELDRSAKEAVLHPGEVVFYRGIAFRYDGQLLQMRIPSGRTLCYRAPEIATVEKDWGPTQVILYLDNTGAKKELYGGPLTENLTQATARDLLANAIFSVEAHGYQVVLHVHDELVAEVAEGFGSIEELCELMCRLPSWAAGLPLKAEGWRGKRYRK